MSKKPKKAPRVALRYPDQTNDLPELDPEKVFFTADTHFFSHQAFIHRHGFRDTDEMSETLIGNWNATVPEDGVVFVVGDFASELPMEKVTGIINRLHGTILLVFGNHDDCGLYRSRKFDVPASKFQVLGLQWTVRLDGQKILLDHYPYLCYAGEHEGVWQLFGHVHSGPDAEGYDIPRLRHLLSYQYDVGVDNNNFRPVSYARVKAKIESQIMLSKQNHADHT